MNPRPSWDELSAYYDQAYAAYGPSHGALDDDETVVERARKEGTFRHLPLPNGKKILDVGSGGGYFLRICRALGADAYGVEPNDLAVAVSRAQGLDIFHGQIGDYEPNVRFDVITANQVLEHTPNPVDVLRKMRTLLADGGMIWVSVPNFACKWARWLGWRWDGADLPFHLLHFTPQSLGRLGENAGLRVRSMKTYSVPAIVKYSMAKHLRHNWLIPERIGARLVSTTWARKEARRLDAISWGDNLIVEFEPG